VATKVMSQVKSQLQMWVGARKRFSDIDAATWSAELQKLWISVYQFEMKNAEIWSEKNHNEAARYKEVLSALQIKVSAEIEQMAQ